MKVWPFGVALRWEASNHHMLRWLKTVVVSDVEKAHGMRQVGIGQTVRSPWFRGSPAELGRVDVLLDDPVFFAPFAAHFDARIGRPSIPMETYLRLMFLKFRYR